MSVFERYLSVWVFLCIVIGIVLGQWLPAPIHFIGGLSVAQVNLPVGILIWVMIIPMLVKVDFGALGQVRTQGRTARDQGMTDVTIYNNPPVPG
jgi:ACR3 family arsenite transporter